MKVWTWWSGFSRSIGTLAMVAVQGKEDSNEDVFAKVSQWMFEASGNTSASSYEDLGSAEGWLADCFNDTEMQLFPDDLNFSGADDVHIDVTEDDMGNASKWKESLAERTLSRKTPSLMQLVYGESTVNSTSINKENDNSEDDFFKPIEEVKKIPARHN